MKKGRTELILDIGSASVGVCVATFTKGQKPLVTHTKRVPIRTDSAEALGGIQALALEALKKNLENIPHTSKPEVIHVVFAAPWYASEIKIVVSESDKVLKIGRATVTHAISGQRAQDAKEIRQGRCAVESAVTQIYVNGYPTALHNPVRGKQLRVHLYESEVDVAFVEAITEIVRHSVPHVPLRFHTFPFLAFATLRALSNEENFTFVDVGGEITDVGVVNRGGLNVMQSFPKGARSLARTIAGTGSLADAISRLTLFARDELSPQESEVFSKLFSTVATSWNEDYGRIQESVLKVTPMPRKTFLMADGEALAWFQKVFSARADMLQAELTLVTPHFFEEHVTLGEGGEYDSFLSLEVLFFAMKKEDLVDL
ncbi:MAG: hypothetical protein V4449_02940 [Patescibacteria group bacterium]